MTDGPVDGRSAHDGTVDDRSALDGGAAARRFAALWASLAPIGSRGDEGYLRYSWTSADLDCREWFEEEARDRDLDVEHDRNGNIWATWLPPGVDPATPAVATGSHLDSVPHGGAYDGPLGVVSALLAVDELRDRGVTPARPIRIAVFTEEEGSRFGLACLGSRLLTGATDPARALALTDRDGVSLADAMTRVGADPAGVGADPGRLAGLAAFVELHIEQGRSLVDSGAPVGIASAIWPHGRWRFDFAGQGNHAGTTRMSDRHDPMLTYAYTVLAANKEARLTGAHATIGRVQSTPNATNAVPSAVTGWLDARAADEPTLARLVEAVTTKAAERAGRDGTTVAVTPESVSPETAFDTSLIDRLRGVLRDAPVLPTGAGHDAGVLAAHVPTAMLFVRNPTGVSHAPAESASDADCAAGVTALADVLYELTR
jgi:N-carbamoyl-L-amino-acid hydrolase